MDVGRLSCGVLMVSGLAAVAAPKQVAAALQLQPAGSRGSAETRAGMGGTFAALGAWSLLSGTRQARRAVGVVWLGAAAARLAALRLDQPETDASYWAYLAAEVGFGVAALLPPPAAA